jgi:hypothetical protein
MIWAWVAGGAGVLVILLLLLRFVVALLGEFDEESDEILQSELEDRRAAADTTW